MSESLKAKDKMLDEGRTVCLHCGYAGEEIQGNYPNLWRARRGFPLIHMGNHWQCKKPRRVSRNIPVAFEVESNLRLPRGIGEVGRFATMEAAPFQSGR